MERKIENYDVIIIGGGSAGLTAGIYCGRARLKTIIIEKSMIGGLATYTNEIENYPGFDGDVTGIELMEHFHNQAKKFGVDFKQTEVKSVDLNGDVKVVETFRIRYEAKVVIIATGGKPRLTGATNENNFLYGKGISFCATCDAAANQDKTVLIVGSGDASIEEGQFITKFATKVIVSVIHDEGKMDCNEIAKADALSNPKLEFVWNTVVDSFEGDEHLHRVNLKNLKTNEIIPIDVDTCFLFIGYLPNTEMFEGILDKNISGYLITNEKMETKVPGVFVAGDVRDKFLRQVSTAVGDGAIAGYGAEKYIAEIEVFNSQILNNGNPSISYVYNAADTYSRELLLVIEEVERRLKDKVKINRIDTYKSDGLAKKLNITTMPSVVYVKNNKIEKVISNNFSVETILALYQ